MRRIQLTAFAIALSLGVSTASAGLLESFDTETTQSPFDNSDWRSTGSGCDSYVTTTSHMAMICGGTATMTSTDAAGVTYFLFELTGGALSLGDGQTSNFAIDPDVSDGGFNASATTTESLSSGASDGDQWRNLSLGWNSELEGKASLEDAPLAGSVANLPLQPPVFWFVPAGLIAVATLLWLKRRDGAARED